MDLAVRLSVLVFRWVGAFGDSLCCSFLFTWGGLLAPRARVSWIVLLFFGGELEKRTVLNPKP